MSPYLPVFNLPVLHFASAAIQADVDMLRHEYVAWTWLFGERRARGHHSVMHDAPRVEDLIQAGEIIGPEPHGFNAGIGRPGRLADGGGVEESLVPREQNPSGGEHPERMIGRSVRVNHNHVVMAFAGHVRD